jgi:hypothetical protein
LERCKQMMDAGLLAKLLELVNNHCTTHLKTIISRLLTHVAGYFQQTDNVITKRQFHDFLKITWELLDAKNERVLERTIQALTRITGLKRNFNEKFDIFDQVSFGTGPK